MAAEKTIKAHQLKVAGWYWWRFSARDAWRPEFFDPAKDATALKIMGGEFVGPMAPPEALEISAPVLDTVS